MAVSVQQLSAVVVVRFSGELTVQDLATAAEEITRIDRTSSALPRLVLARGVTISAVSASELAAFSAQRAMTSPVIGQRAAILVETDTDLHIAEQWRDRLANDGPRVGVFRDRSEAFAWLGVRDVE